MPPVTTRPATRGVQVHHGFARIPALALTVLLMLAGAPPAASGGPVATAAAEPTLTQLIGQKLVIRMNGRTPSSSLLGRVRRGEVGGIVLFGFNLTTRDALVSAVNKLQAAAREGGQPPLLTMADQEGGNVRVIPWAPTAYSARDMNRVGTTAFVEGKGAAVGKGLRASGVNVNLAPVADVPVGTSGFMYLAERTFSATPSRTARLTLAFARGLTSYRVAATFKHFPGIGRVKLNTDRYVQTVTASRTQLENDLVPFKAAIAAKVPLIMLSNATYTAYDGSNAAGWSRRIATDLLRTTLGFTGVSLTDSLNGTAKAREVSATGLGFRAIRAGVDMVMLTGEEAGTDAAFDYLLAKAQAGRIPLNELRASYDRIVALKSSLVP